MLHPRMPTLSVMHAIGDQTVSACTFRFMRLILPLPFHTRFIWLIPLPEEWSWLPTWCPGVHPDSYKDADMWKKPQYVGAQSLSSAEPAASSTATSSVFDFGTLPLVWKTRSISRTYVVNSGRRSD